MLVLTTAGLLEINNSLERRPSLSLHRHMFVGLGAHVRLRQVEFLGGFADQKSAVFVVDLLAQQFDEDAPGRPGVADLAPAERVLVDLEQLLDDVLHAEDPQVLPALLSDHPCDRLLVYYQQLVRVLAVFADLSVEHDHFLQVLLRVFFAPDGGQQESEALLQLRGDLGLLACAVIEKVLLQLVLLVLVAPLRDPIDEAPHGLEDNTVQYIRIDDLAQSGLGHVLQLQVHPHELRVGLHEELDLVEQQVVVHLANPAESAALLPPSEQILLLLARRTDAFAGEFFLDAEDEILEGAGEQIVGVEDLLQSDGELLVVLEQVGDFGAGGGCQPIHEDRLGQQQTAALQPHLRQLLLLRLFRGDGFAQQNLARQLVLGLLVRDDQGEHFGVGLVVGVVLQDGGVEVVHFAFAPRRPHEAVHDALLDFLGGDLVEVLLVGPALEFLAHHFLAPGVAVGQQQLVELLAVDRPYFLELVGEVLREFGADLLPPGVLAVVREGLQQLLQQTVHILDPRLGQLLPVGVQQDAVALLEHRVDVVDGLVGLPGRGRT